MKKFALPVLLLAGAFTLLVFFGVETESDIPRTPASAPLNYEAMKACEKQEALWEKVQTSEYKDLPAYRRLHIPELWKMSRQEIGLKGSRHSDFAPKGWKKYLHARGALAKVKVVAKENKYTGIFQGAECALIRLSLTYKVNGSKAVAPGLAFKVLRDGVSSANVSALVSLDGQERDYNFFKHPLSNIVPAGNDIGQKLVHRIFRKVTKYPEELLASDMALVDAQGVKTRNLKAPRQMFFVPTGDLKFSSEEHDVRDDFLSIPEGTLLYKIYLLSDKHKDFDYADYTDEKAAEFLKDSQYVGDIVTTSEFLASEFGDDGLFFRHQLRP